jgi:lipopolysaccharide export system protein LptC
MGAHRHYTRLVALIKHSLWLLVAGMVGIVVWIASDSSDNGSRLVFSNATPKDMNVESTMVKPHYQGLDAKNQPFNVIAEKATQIDKDTVLLENINADMLQSQNSKDTWLALTAKEGKLDTKTKEMLLSGGVALFYEGGYEFRSDHATVDVQKGAASSDAKVEGQGPMGTLTANAFSAEDHGRVIRFNGSVRMKIYR